MAGKSLNIICIRIIAGFRSRKETPIGLESVETVKACEKRVTQDGESSRVCYIDPEEEPSPLLLHKEGVSPFQGVPVIVGLVHLPGRRTLLPIYRLALRLGPVPL